MRHASVHVIRGRPVAACTSSSPQTTHMLTTTQNLPTGRGLRPQRPRAPATAPPRRAPASARQRPPPATSRRTHTPSSAPAPPRAARQSRGGTTAGADPRTRHGQHGVPDDRAPVDVRASHPPPRPRTTRPLERRTRPLKPAQRPHVLVSCQRRTTADTASRAPRHERPLVGVVPRRRRIAARAVDLLDHGAASSRAGGKASGATSSGRRFT